MSRTTHVTFNIWPDRANKPYYYKILVFGDRAAMLVFWEEQVKRLGYTGKSAAFDFRAVTQSWTTLRCGRGPRGGRWKESHQIGNILLNREDMGAGMVAHECGHAALHYAEVHLKIKARELYHDAPRYQAKTSGEERMLYVLGGLVAQFWSRFYARAPKAWLKGRP